MRTPPGSRSGRRGGCMARPARGDPLRHFGDDQVALPDRWENRWAQTAPGFL